MKRCTRCDSVIDWDKPFCPLCGGSVTDAPGRAAVQEPMYDRFEPDLSEPAVSSLPLIPDTSETGTEPPMPVVNAPSGLPPVPPAPQAVSPPLPPIPGMPVTPPAQIPVVRAVPPVVPSPPPSPMPVVNAPSGLPPVPPAPQAVSPPLPQAPGSRLSPLPGESPSPADLFSQIHQAPGARPAPAPFMPGPSSSEQPPAGVISQIHQAPVANVSNPQPLVGTPPPVPAQRMPVEPPAPPAAAPGVFSQIHQATGAGESFVPPVPPSSSGGFFSQIHQSTSAEQQVPGRHAEGRQNTLPAAQTAPQPARDPQQAEAPRTPMRNDVSDARHFQANVPQNSLTTLLDVPEQKEPAHYKKEEPPRAIPGMMDMKPAGGVAELKPEDSDPPGAHFAPSQDGASGLPENARSKHGNDDGAPPESEFLRMFPGARA